jgi:hypothetical protein
MHDAPTSTAVDIYCLYSYGYSYLHTASWPYIRPAACPSCRQPLRPGCLRHWGYAHVGGPPCSYIRPYDTAGPRRPPGATTVPTCSIRWCTLRSPTLCITPTVISRPDVSMELGTQGGASCAACPVPRSSSECRTQCDRVCLDDRLRQFVDRCCPCKSVCTLDTSEKAAALTILGLCLL